MSDARKDFILECVAVGEVDHTAFIPFALAYGTSPSGKPVPIRVDEDGYVLARPTGWTETSCNKTPNAVVLKCFEDK